MAYGCEEERFPVPIPAVDTHRPKPARRNTGDNPAPMTTGEKASGAAPARDYFGDAAPTATAQVMDTSTKGTDDPAQSESEPDPSGTTRMSAEKARQSILLEHAEAHGKKASETTQEEAGISQADIARALQVQRTIGTRQPVRLTKFSDLPAERAEGALCAPVAAASSKKYNRHKMYCPRPECQSVILSPGTADWVVEEGGMVRALMTTAELLAITDDQDRSYRTIQVHPSALIRKQTRPPIQSYEILRYSGMSAVYLWYLRISASPEMPQL
jgi:hypothetical protein